MPDLAQRPGDIIRCVLPSSKPPSAWSFMMRPRRADGEILIAVELAGVCGSDVSLFLGHRPGPYPFIMGHEAIGRVVEPGASGLEPGRRVVIEPNFPCGRCAICQDGHGNVCPE